MPAWRLESGGGTNRVPARRIPPLAMRTPRVAYGGDAGAETRPSANLTRGVLGPGSRTPGTAGGTTVPRSESPSTSPSNRSGWSSGVTNRTVFPADWTLSSG